MAPEIGSLRALSNGESQFVGSSSGVYFINTVKRAFATPAGAAAENSQRTGGTDPCDDPSPEDCIVGGGENTAPEAPGTGPGRVGPSEPYSESNVHVSPISTGRDFMDDMENLPDYPVARELVLTYFRMWHPLVPFLQGPECLAGLESLYGSDSNSDRQSASSISLLVTFRCIFNIARLESDGPLDIGSTAIRSPSELLPTLSLLALRCDMGSIQALLSAQVYFISTMSLRHASSVSGLISKSIYQSGMHRCPVRYEHLSSGERSMRKRIFWSFYVLDRFVSQSLGHPNGIQDSDIDVCPPGHRDLHEPVTKSTLSPGSAGNPILHLPSNHPDRLTTSPAGQADARDSSLEKEEGYQYHDDTTDKPDVDTSSRSAAILRHRKETQTVLENHVRHSQLVGRILEVFHKSIHARDLEHQTVLFLKADVAAFGNDVNQPCLKPVLPDIQALTPDPSMFPFVAYHYTVILLNRPSLSLDSRRAEFREALQICISAANTIIRTIDQYAENGGPLFWPGYMSAVWMSGLVLALAARLKLYKTTKAKPAIHVALGLLTTMVKRWEMARHCKEVLSVLLQSIGNETKSHKRSRSEANFEDDIPQAVHGASGHQSTRNSTKRRNTEGCRASLRASANDGHASTTSRVDVLPLGLTHTLQGPTRPLPQTSRDGTGSRTQGNRWNNLRDVNLPQHNATSPQAFCADYPQYSQHCHTETSQFAAPSSMNTYINATPTGLYAPIPTTFPDRQRHLPSQYVDQFSGTENFFDIFDGATWGSLLDIVNDAGTGTYQ